MTIFFINAPIQALRRALPLIKEKKFKDLTIITTKDLVPFFKKYTDAKIIVPKLNRNLIDKHTKYKVITNAIKSKFEYRKLFKDVENEDIYLFFTFWAIVHFSYIKKLSKKNKVYLYPEDKTIYSFKENKTLTAKAMKLTARMLLGIKIKVVNCQSMPICELDRTAFPMEVVHYNKFEVELPGDYEKLLKGKDVFFAGSADMSLETKNINKFIKMTDDVADILENKFKDRYVVKGHPRDDTIYGKLNNSKHKIDRYILAEMLMEHPWKYVIGYYSELLTSAKLRTDAKVISLIYLWEWKDLEYQKYWIDRFKKEGVLMPKTKTELKKVLV